MATRSIALATFSALILALASGIRVTAAAEEQHSPFEGVWRTLEVVVPGDAPRTFRPEATLAIFHGRHYSRVEVHTEQARQPLLDPSTASADELRAVWGPFVGEAGNFELRANGVIAMQAIVAKNPSAMTRGAVSVFTYRLDGNTLTLTQVRTGAAQNANPVNVTLTRVE
jgi:hypothetical protein